MIRLDEAREFALSLPGSAEAPHFQYSSYRVEGKIFATVPPDGEHLHVFVEEPSVRAAVTADAAAFEELWWGRRLVGVRVNLPAADPDWVTELLEEAWRRKAPRGIAGTCARDTPAGDP